MKVPSSVLVIAAFVLGLSGGYFGRSYQSGLAPAPKTYEQGYDAAKSKLEGLGMLKPEPSEVKTLVGTIVEVKDGSFILKPDGSVLNPLVRDVPETREVAVEASTEITANVEKDKAAFQKELAAYQAATTGFVPGPGNRPSMPSPILYELKKIALSELTAGMIVEVGADADIKYQRRFVAARIFSVGTGELLQGRSRPEGIPDVPPGGTQHEEDAPAAGLNGNDAPQAR